jgi:hypothetical protein
MKKFILPLFVFLAGVCATANAQDASGPGAYMDSFSNPQIEMNQSYMAYISASAHSSRKRKIEQLRENAVESIVTCQNTINYLPAYNGDNSLKLSCVKYVDLCYKIFNDDYAHIVNMDDIAEQSYDEMQAYLLLQQATDDTLQAAIKRINKAEKDFADKYNVNMVNEKTELGDKMETTNRLNAYRNKVYLVFYKCNWEDNQLTAFVNQKNVTKIEQVRSALDKYAIEGLAVMDTLQAYEHDASMINACKQALSFYKSEAETSIPLVTDFFLKQENFDKLKTDMDGKSDSQRTQQYVDNYNKAVNDLNAAVVSFNQNNDAMNNARNDVNNTWDNTEKVFIDAHTPYYK